MPIGVKLKSALKAMVLSKDCSSDQPLVLPKLCTGQLNSSCQLWGSTAVGMDAVFAVMLSTEEQQCY